MKHVKLTLLFALILTLFCFSMTACELFGGGGDECAHSFGEWGVTTPATCGARGTETRTCSACGEEEQRALSALGHDEVTHAAQDPACTQIGWQSYVTCTRCTYSTYAEIPALGHNEISHTAQAPTCTEPGWEAYVTCSRCDHSTYAEIPARSHDLITHEAQEPTDDAPGWEEYVTCTRCDYTTYVEIPSLSHNMMDRDGREPTCTEVGWLAYTVCDHCDYTTYEELPALGHDYVSGTCSRCGDIDWQTQDGDTVELPADDSYTEDVLFFGGYQAWQTYCAENGIADAVLAAYAPAFFEENVLAILRLVGAGENESVAFDYVLTDTTYVLRAVREYDPNTLGVAVMGSYYAAAPISRTLLEGIEEIEVYSRDLLLGVFALGGDHQHSYDDGTLTQESTCSVPGVMLYTCLDCGHEREVRVPTAEHTFGEWNAVAANGCAGSPYSLRVCLDCQYVEYRLNHVGIQHPHDFELTYTAPTCEAGGMIKLICKNCGIVGADEILPATDHLLMWEQGEDAHRLTCMRDGCDYATEAETHTADTTSPCLDATCTVCGYPMWDGEGHAVSPEWESDATGHWQACTRPGCGMTSDKLDHRNPQAICTDTTATCTVCGETYTPNGSHRMGEWTLTTSPTCTEQGEWRRVCAYCDAYQSKNEPAWGHTWGAWIETTAPTETVDGEEQRTCAVCGESETRQLPATGHHYGAWQILTDATCTTAGEKRRDCVECDAYQTAAIPSLGHTVLHWNTATAPTCVEGGLENGYCHRCNLYIERSIDALDHEWGSYYHDAATHWQECTRCDVKSAPVAHSGGTATCTTQANCATCGTAYGKIPGHRFDVAFTVDSETHYFICLNGCGEKRDVEAHNFVARTETMQVQDDGAQITYTHRLYQSCGICGHDVLVQEIVNAEHYGCEIMPAIAPTCTTDGWTIGWRCAVADCGRVYQTQERIPALGHNYENGACTHCGLADHVCSNGTWTNTQTRSCLQDGVRELICYCGNVIRRQVTPAYGHSYIAGICTRCLETQGGIHLCIGSSTVTLQEPTCTESGVKEYICSCGSKLYTQAVPALGHSFSGGRCTRCGTAECDHEHTRNLIGYAATCTTAGLSDGIYCLDCGLNVEPQTTIYPLGHDYSTAWGYNLDTHYHACQRVGCSAKADVGEHVYDNALDEICNTCQAIRGQAFISLGGIIYASDNDTNMANNSLLSGVSCVATVNGNTYTATSNSSGRFSFAELPAGNITLTFTKGGYITATYTAVIADNTDLQIVMDADVSNTLSGRITIADRDTDFTNNSPLANATVTIVRISSTNTLRFVTTTNYNGYYSFDGLTAGVYTMLIECDGYISVEQTVQVRQDEANVQNIVIEAIPDSQINDGYASGYIYDARTGLAVNGISVIIRAGINNTTGPILMTLKTNTNGMYTTTALAPGNYTAQIVDERSLSDETYRYGSITIAVKVMSDTTIYNQNGTISNSVGLDVNGMRIVLTWGSRPSDLDSHMTGTINGSSFHVYYSRKNYGSYVGLDVDDVSAYGPETITIYDMGDGIFKYYIYNFSGGGDYVLSNSGATVKVYMDGETTPAYTFYVPYDAGRYWHVFTYNSITGEFTIINDISSSAP